VDREYIEKKYLKLGNELPAMYPDLDFENHCYWRISLDNVVGNKWDRVIDKPAYKNLSLDQLQRVVDLMKSYKTDIEVLKENNKRSLEYRGKK